MSTVVLALQLLVALVILNVWLRRAGRETDYRGGDARNLKEEFQVYGLPPAAFYTVGFFKIVFALGLLAGIWVPMVATWSAIGMAGLMLGAVAMHLKVRDPLPKGMPAFVLLVLAVFIAAN